MKLYEYQAKELFREFGIPIQRGFLIESPEELEELDISYPLVLKAQVLVGGRGKAGGIKLAESLEDAKMKAFKILGMKIKGEKVSKLLVLEAFEILKEYYLSFTIDRSKRSPVCIASSCGGIDIEEVAEKSPEKLLKLYFQDFKPYNARVLGSELGLKKKKLSEFAKVAFKLYNLFKAYDATLSEINPLALTPQGFLAIDAKLVIDDNALFRQNLKETEGEYTKLELEAKLSGLSYVELSGDIAIIGCGAGLVMASLDVVQNYGGKPANFCDVGGGATAKSMRKALEIVTKKKGVKTVFCNIFGGITRCDEIARGIIDFNSKIPISVRMMGTNEREGIELLKRHGFKAFSSMEEAAKRAVELSS
ncbi:MAG: ADP-forming succinate--CoA ligase subunit beta [Candidatus Methanofastidiosia archaeon]